MKRNISTFEALGTAHGIATDLRTLRSYRGGLKNPLPASEVEPSSQWTKIMESSQKDAVQRRSVRGPLSDEHKHKLRLANLGKKHSPEHLINHRAAQKTRKRPGPWTEEHRRNQGNAQRGQKRTDEQKANIRAGRKNGKPMPKRGPMSDEHKRKIGAGNTGKKKGPTSGEQKAKISAANTGKKNGPMSDETKAKLRVINTGTKRGQCLMRQRRRSGRGLRARRRRSQCLVSRRRRSARGTRASTEARGTGKNLSKSPSNDPLRLERARHASTAARDVQKSTA